MPVFSFQLPRNERNTTHLMAIIYFASYFINDKAANREGKRLREGIIKSRAYHLALLHIIVSMKLYETLRG